MPENREEQKAIIKEAIREWLQEKFTDFGYWSIKSLAALAFAAFVYFIATHTSFGGANIR